MNQTAPFRLVIACGGTGGHLFPGIAVAQTAMERGWETLLLISEKQIDTLATEGYKDLKFERLAAMAMPKLASPAFVRFLWRFWRTRRQCVRLFHTFRPNAVLGMGGFTSLAPCMAARKYGARTFIHDSNVLPGKANRLAARYCHKVLLGMQPAAQCFRPGLTCFTGTPIRAAMMRPPPAAEARAFFHLEPDPGRKTVLIMGGSQGARGVNTAVEHSLPALAAAANRVQILHITGPAGIDHAQLACGAHPELIARLLPFCQRMELACAAADLAVARAGGGSLAELSAFGLPSLLVPYPFAADDHQRLNADFFARNGAAVMIEESQLLHGRLATALMELLDSPHRLREMSECMRRMNPGDAAARICDTIAATDPATSSPRPSSAGGLPCPD